MWKKTESQKARRIFQNKTRDQLSTIYFFLLTLLFQQQSINIIFRIDIIEQYQPYQVIYYSKNASQKKQLIKAYNPSQISTQYLLTLIIKVNYKQFSSQKIQNSVFESSDYVSNLEKLKQLDLNPYLLKRLNAQKLLPLKDFQIQTFKTIETENKNCFVNSCTGSGKTLSYLLPIMNRVLKQKNNLLSKNSQRSQNSHNQSYKEGYKPSQKHGALIFTLNKELCLQVYRDIRKIDKQNQLNCYRIGPISYFSPVIAQLVNLKTNFQNNKQKTVQDQANIDDLINSNIGKCIKWSKTDILISTPQMYCNFISSMINSKNQQDIINPEFVVIDEADLMLQIDQNVSKSMNKIIKVIKGQQIQNKKYKLKGKSGILNFIKQQAIQQSQNTQSTQYIMCSSSFPKKVNKKPTSQYFQQKFKPINIVTGVNKHRLPDRLELNYVEIKSKKKDFDETTSLRPENCRDDQVDNEKLFYLEKILTNPEKSNDKFIIFCNSKQKVEKIAQFIQLKLGKKSIQYYSALSAEQRSSNLHKFSYQGYQYLISTDLGSRGLDFPISIHTVIQYQMANNVVNFINRAGRTARNDLPGEIITFVQPHNRSFFEHLSAINSNDQDLDQLFSRKRSYNKLILNPKR